MSGFRAGPAELALGGLAVGLGLVGSGVAPTWLVLAAFATFGVAVCSMIPGSARLEGLAASVATVAACVGLGALVGDLRVEALERSALRPETGRLVTVTGFVASPPKRQGQGVLGVVATSAGRIAVISLTPSGLPSVGSGIEATGKVTRPEAWRRDWLRRQGVASVLRAQRVEVTDDRRAGLPGRIDAIRDRASAALGDGVGEPEAALARGFVLGADEGIDPITVERFRRSGLAHLLAVSGQNVVLLGLLAWPFLSLAGLTLRARLVALLGLILLYVLVTGAGPSIQRAGVMGAAAAVCGLAGRPSARRQALLLAGVVTLLLSPLAVADPGWQLSFAATAGIMAWAPRLSAAVRGERSTSALTLRSTAAEALAVSAAATIATLPLLSGTFGALPVVSLPANLLALPAVAPSMWLGMASAAAGQVDWVPTAPINRLNSLCLGYIQQVAAWAGDLPWATVEIALSPLGTVAITLAVIAGFELGLASLSRRRGLGTPRRATLALVSLVALLMALLPAVRLDGGDPNRATSNRMVVCALDVGQGDALLLDPPGPSATLVDTGPPDAGIARLLRERGVEGLTHLVITHDQLDHSGGVDEILSSMRVEWLVHSGESRRLSALAAQAGVREARVAEGSELRSGALRLLVTWPPRSVVSGQFRGDDPNARSLVLLGSWRHLTFLLPGDAEAESVPMPGAPIDLLKVAHHGSEDSGLSDLLARAVPRVALVSVGAGNAYGHPHDATIAVLSARGTAVLRTDRQGSVGATSSRRRWLAGPC